MTTIAYRDQIIACDSQVASSSLITIHKRNKVKQLSNGLWVCMSGHLDYTDLICKRVMQIDKLCQSWGVEQASFQVMVLDPKERRVMYLDETMPTSSWYALPEYFALGSGAVIATTAMHLGRSAYLAVQTASELDIHTGGEIQRFRIPFGTVE